MLQKTNSYGTDLYNKTISILKVLSESTEPLASAVIARQLERYGIFLSDRAVRYYLEWMDLHGFTKSLGHRGRFLTSIGVQELHKSMAPEQIGFIIEKLEAMAFSTTFNPLKKTGLVPINVTLIDRERIEEALVVMRDVMKAGFCVSELVAIAVEGENLGSVIIPAGKVGLATVCSVVINGVLLKSGVPAESRFGGVMEINNRIPRRFTAIISYSATSLDPSEQYISAKMTNVLSALQTGNGKVLANFREITAPSKSLVNEKLAQLKEVGICGTHVLGNIGEPVCQIAVGSTRLGMVLLGGLNPMAAISESGIDTENVAECGLIEYNKLKSLH